jgi:hypothetical protein
MNGDRLPIRRLMLRLALLVGLFAAASALTAAEQQTLQFMVRAQPDDAVPRCDPASVGRCRDDLSLTQVFAELRGMAIASTAAAFAGAARAAAVEVQLGAGVFRVTEPLRLSVWNGAGRFGSLRIVGMGASATTISGAVMVPAGLWRSVPEGDNRVPQVSRSHVKVIGLSTLWGKRVDGRQPVTGFGEAVVPAPLLVSAGGQLLTLARWPNSGWAYAESRAQALSAAGGAVRQLSIRGARLPVLQQEPDLRVVGYFSHDWAFERIPVVDMNGNTGVITLQGPGAKFGVRNGQRVFVENALSELDAAGEWYFDTAQQALYVWPTAAGWDAGMEVALATGLLHVEDSSQVTIAELALTGSTGDAVRIDASHQITLTDATVRLVGNRAVLILGGTGVVLRRVAMSDLGEGGVFASGGDRRSLGAAGHVIEACRIERFATHSRSYRPAISIEGVGIQLLRNRIADGPHSAIVFGGNEHRIEGNHISDVVTETNDAGAIYTGRDWTARGTVITNNLLQNIYPRLAGTNSVMGIYLDDQASGTRIVGNVFANVSRAVLIGGGRENIVERNLFVASSPGIFADNRGTTWQRDMTSDVNGTLQRNLRNMPVADIAYRSRYPRLASVLSDEPGRTKYNQASGNLFVASREFEFLDGAQEGLAVSANRAVPWSAFKSLRGPKAKYAPGDFELAADMFTSVDRAAYPSRDGIAP